MTNTIKILYLGDIFGMPGREVVREFLPSLIDKHDLDLVLANCENAAQGRGISERLVNELLGYGVDFMTVEIIFTMLMVCFLI